MNNEMWFVQKDGEAVGPLSHAELLDLARRGGISAGTPASTDGESWQPVESVPGLVLGPPVLPLLPPKPSVWRSPKRLALWCGGFGAVALLNLCLCTGMYMSFLEAYGFSAPESDPAAPLAQRLRASSNAPSADPSHVATAVQTSPARSALSIRISDGTEDLRAILRALPDADREALVQAALKSKKNLYAIRLDVRNTGSAPVDVDPGFLRMVGGNSDVLIWDQAVIRELTPETHRFLQPTRLASGGSTSGLVGFTTDDRTIDAMRRGEIVLRYTDFAIAVTYE